VRGARLHYISASLPLPIARVPSYTGLATALGPESAVSAPLTLLRVLFPKRIEDELDGPAAPGCQG
jgi:hypothetical protein